MKLSVIENHYIEKLILEMYLGKRGSSSNSKILREKDFDGIDDSIKKKVIDDLIRNNYLKITLRGVGFASYQITPNGEARIKILNSLIEAQNIVNNNQFQASQSRFADMTARSNNRASWIAFAALFLSILSFLFQLFMK